MVLNRAETPVNRNNVAECQRDNETPKKRKFDRFEAQSSDAMKQRFAETTKLGGFGNVVVSDIIRECYQLTSIARKQ